LHRSPPAFDGSTNAKKRRKRRPAHNLLNRFKTFKQETLRFLTDFEVPVTNNLPEQDLRMMKAKMKISGGFRTEKGAADFARLRSVISSARKQGFNILAALTPTPERLAVALTLWTRLRFASHKAQQVLALPKMVEPRARLGSYSPLSRFPAFDSEARRRAVYRERAGPAGTRF
jgi:hypothetical protein